MEIKNKLKQIIHETGHHPFLFVGAGFFRRYIRTEKWDELLRHFCENLARMSLNTMLMRPEQMKRLLWTATSDRQFFRERL